MMKKNNKANKNNRETRARLEEIVKGVWRMPRLWEAKKDVVSCEKLRGLAHMNWSADIRMGQPDILKIYHTERWANPENWNI